VRRRTGAETCQVEGVRSVSAACFQRAQGALSILGPRIPWDAGYTPGAPGQALRLCRGRFPEPIVIQGCSKVKTLIPQWDCGPGRSSSRCCVPPKPALPKPWIKPSPKPSRSLLPTMLSLACSINTRDIAAPDRKWYQNIYMTMRSCDNCLG
jgi:hypothetical protein